MANILSLPKEEGDVGDDDDDVWGMKSTCPALKKCWPALSFFVDLAAGLRGEPFGKHTHTNPSG